ncbi:MAG: methyltransferase [Deltaproteobacteria bacterium RBG_16_49_23]|nr:MAG: methyltransferase [Deltaproteobacteria bacterium RBG_16_49_23]
MIDGEKFYLSVSQGKMDEVRNLVQGALDAGDRAERVLKEGLIQAMDRLGVRFKNGEIYIPEVLLAARAMHAGMAILKPILSKSTETIAGKVLIGTVKGDLHDIGKNLVVMMIEGGGFDVIDLGIDVPASRFVEAVKEHRPQVVGMSALLTTTMVEMKKAIQALEAAGQKDQVKIIIGGAPVTERFAMEIGADGYAPDAAVAVDVVRSWISK